MGNDCFRDIRGDRVFQIQHVSKLFIKLPGPHRGSVEHAEQLNSYTNAILGPSHSPVENESDTQLAPSDDGIGVSAIAQNAIRWPDRKTSYGAQPGDQCIGKPGSKIIRS